MAAALLAALTAPPAAAGAAGEPPPAEISAEELREIERGLRSDHAAAAEDPHLFPSPAQVAPPPSGGAQQGSNPDLSLTLDLALGAFTAPPSAQMGWGAHDPRRNGFTLQQLELFAAANVDPYFHLDTAIVFDPQHVEIEEVYGTTLALPANLQLRGGKFLSRFGRLNPLHPHQWHFLHQPLVLQKFMGSEGNSGLGLEASWLSPLPWFLEASLAATDAGGGGHGGQSAASFLADGPRAALTSPAGLLYTGTVKQFFSLPHDLSMLAGVSGQTGPNRGGGRSQLAGLDIMVRHRPLASALRRSLSLQLEVLWRQRDWPGQRRREMGAYAELLAGISPLWEAGLRVEAVGEVRGDFVGAGGHGDHGHHHDHGHDHDHGAAAAGDWPGGRRRLLAQLTYFPSHFSRLRLQGLVDQPRWQGATIFGAFVAAELSVGAHGAHSY